MTATEHCRSILLEKPQCIQFPQHRKESSFRTLANIHCSVLLQSVVASIQPLHFINLKIAVKRRCQRLTAQKPSAALDSSKLSSAANATIHRILSLYWPFFSEAAVAVERAHLSPAALVDLQVVLLVDRQPVLVEPHGLRLRLLVLAEQGRLPVQLSGQRLRLRCTRLRLLGLLARFGLGLQEEDRGNQ